MSKDQQSSSDRTITRNKKSPPALFVQLSKHLTTRRRHQLGLLFLLVIAASIAEAISIGTVMPFLVVLTAPETVFIHPSAQSLIHLLGISDAKQLVLPFTLSFASAALLTCAVRSLLLWLTMRWSFGTGADLSIEIYRRALYQPYSVHISTNTSEIIAGISTKVNSVIIQLLNLINLASAGVILFGIFGTLLLINTKVALTAIIGFALVYASIVWKIHDRVKRNSLRISNQSVKAIKSLQEGLGSIRDILLDGTQTVYCRSYQDADEGLRTAQGSNAFLAACPRNVVEAVGMLLIALFAYFLNQYSNGLSQAVPILGTLALAAQRMLPAMQSIYASWILIRGEIDSLDDIIKLLGQPLPHYAGLPNPKPLKFRDQIEFKGIHFYYSDGKEAALNEINIKIEKGSRVGLIGATGSGKSTLLDILMGLLTPTNGTVEIDGIELNGKNLRHWQACIAHVPQHIFLADSTIAQNIALGVATHEIDSQRVIAAAKKAQLHQDIQGWKHGYRTQVGERGVRLSGGQRQRIGIARALYKEAAVIIFDEATSALDTETEQAVMASIDDLDKSLTIVLVAHRLTTLQNCSQIIELKDHRVRRIGPYSDFSQERISDSR